MVRATTWAAAAPRRRAPPLRSRRRRPCSTSTSPCDVGRQPVMTCSTGRGIFRFGPRSLTPGRHPGTRSNQAGHAPRESAISEVVRPPRARPYRGAMFGKAVTNQPDNVSGHECDHHGSPVLDRARARCGDGGHARTRAPRTPLAPPRARIGLGRHHRKSRAAVAAAAMGIPSEQHPVRPTPSVSGTAQPRWCRRERDPPQWACWPPATSGAVHDDAQTRARAAPEPRPRW